MSNSKTEYLGDSVYAELFQDELVLYTSNGRTKANYICVEPATWEALKRFMTDAFKKGDE